MREETRELLEKIHQLHGAEEFINLCDEIYEVADEIVKYRDFDDFMAVNYLFAIDPGYGFTTIVNLFKDFLVSALSLDTLYANLNGLKIDEIVSLDPVKKIGTNSYGFSALEEIKWRKSEGFLFHMLFSTVDLIKEELHLETEEMDNFFRLLASKKSKGLYIFHAPYMPEGIPSVYERVISKKFPIKVIHFTRPSNEIMVKECKNRICNKQLKSQITEEQIQHEIDAFVEKGIFRGYSSLELVKKNLIYKELMGKNNTNEFSASEKFNRLAIKYQQLEEKTKEIVMGQEHAIHEIIGGLFSSELGNSVQRSHGPKATFLLMGSPGVGKTLIAKTMGEVLEIPSLVLNMSDYSNDKSMIDLVGSSKRFRNASEGKLVQFVRQNSKAIVIFDEIEKAHLSCIHLLLQILDMGILLDAYTEQYVDFSKIIIFFTSNVGKTLYEDERNQELSRLPKRNLLDTLENEKRPGTNEPFFPQAICSRLMAGNVIMLNRMDTETLLSIVKSAMNKTVASLTSLYEISIDVSEDIPALFMYQEGDKLDARVASKKSPAFIKKEIYEVSRLMKDTPNLFEGIKKFRFEVADEDNENIDLLRPDIRDIPILYIGNPVFDRQSNSFVRIKYVTEREKIAEALKEEFVSIIIDPYLDYIASEQENLCINDIDSEGMRILHDLVNKGLGIPIYILDKDNSFSDTDKDSFALDGAAGCISAGSTEDEFEEEIKKIARKHYITELHSDFCNRGYCLDCSSRQIVNGDELMIQFYDLKRRVVFDSQSAKIMVSAAERPTVKFDEIIGAEEAKEELRYFVNYLKEPKRILAGGGRLPRGILLYGKPGTGKTMLAKALAGESDATFISTSASEFLAPLSGEGEIKIRKLFATARRYAPSIIFIDEIDAIGKLRTGGNHQVETLLNTLLTEIDGFITNNKKPVFVLAATNFGVKGDRDKKVALDPALLRRFDNQIYVDLPRENERIKYLKLFQEKNNIAKYTNDGINHIAKRTIGRSIAEIENILELANRNAIKMKNVITDESLIDAYEQFHFGLKKEQMEEHYRAVAIHESGHAYIAHLSGNTPMYITITGRENFAGYVAPSIDEDKGQYTAQEYRWMIREKLAGRIAEKVILGDNTFLNTGASKDLSQATELAIAMVVHYGFVEGQMLTLSYDFIDKFGIPSEYLNMANEIILEEEQECEKLILEGKNCILNLVDAVSEKNNLMMEEIRQVLDQGAINL